MTTVRQSLLFSFADKYLTQALALGTTAIMARLLTPAETGLFMIGFSLILMIEAFRDFGVGTYIVQKKELDDQLVRTAFTVTMLLSVTMGSLLFLSAGLIGRFYDQPELATILRVGTIGFVLVPFGTPLFGLLRREMAFSTLAWINVAAAVCNTVCTVTLAQWGIGAVSYIWGFVAASSTATALAFIVRGKTGYFRPSLHQWREVTSFGTVSSLVTLLNMAFDLLPRLLLGRLWSLDAVGIFTRATTICQLPDRTITSALQPVVLPAMAAQARTGGDLKATYLYGHRLMSVVQWPILTVLALLALPAVRVLLGDQWLEAAPLVRTMALAATMLAPAFMTYPLLVSAGRIKDALHSSLISLPVSAVIVTVATFFGTQALATSMFLVAPLQMAVAFWFIARVTGLTWRDLAEASGQSALTTIAAIIVPGLVVLTSPSGLDLDAGRTVLAIGGAFLGWLAGLYATAHPLSSELTRAWRGLASSVSRNAAS